jgi:hypothetical protein
MEADRKSVVKSLVIALDVVAALGASAVIVVGYVAPRAFEANAPSVDATRIVVESSEARLAFGCSLLVLLANVLYLLYARKLRAPLRHVTSEVEGGQVHIARDAIESSLRGAGEALAEVARLRVSLVNAGMKRVLARVQYQSPDGCSVHDATRRLRHALEQRFAEMVHLVDGARVDWEIEFVGFVPLGKGQKKPAPLIPIDRQGADRLDDTFTGPRYPIDDEDPYGGRKHG